MEMDPPGKSFVLEHIFENASSMRGYQTLIGPDTEHFGLQWNVMIQKAGTQAIVFLRLECVQSDEAPRIDLSCQFSLISKNGISWSTEPDSMYGNAVIIIWSTVFHDWNTVRNCLMVNGAIRMMVRVKIHKIEGIYQPNLRAFDVSMKQFSDTVLVVQDREFYVLKQFLALHSPFFNTLLLGEFVEAQQTRVTLNNIFACDFQKFLELLYGDWSIDEVTVESLLSLADMYDTSIVRQKCQHFLVNTSQKALATKRRLADEYNLEELKAQCVREIETAAEQQEQ